MQILVPNLPECTAQGMELTALKHQRCRENQHLKHGDLRLGGFSSAGSEGKREPTDAGSGEPQKRVASHKAPVKAVRN